MHVRGRNRKSAPGCDVTEVGHEQNRAWDHDCRGVPLLPYRLSSLYLDLTALELRKTSLITFPNPDRGGEASWSIILEQILSGSNRGLDPTHWAKTAVNCR